MIAAGIAWLVAAACLLAAAAVLVLHRAHMREALERAKRAEQTLALLGAIAPAFTEAAAASLPLTCERIVERSGALIEAQTILCLVAHDGQLLVGGKSDDGYAGFLRIGDPCEGDSIVDWVAHAGKTALIGPHAAGKNSTLPNEVTDLSQTAQSRQAGPLVGSRDRVWTLCVPMLQQRGHGLRPAFIGALYLERSHDKPFAPDEIRCAELIARFGGDALLRAQYTDEVKRESAIDQLTGLLGPAAFRKRLRLEVEKRCHPLPQERPDVALFFIDTDRFKLWNDSFGHAVGDMVLKRLAAIFQDVATSGGFAGRNGGDEFCIALLDRTKDDAIEVAERLRERVERTDLGASADGAPTPRIPVSISIGVAHFPVDVAASAPAPSDLLLEAADARMYEAKRAGGNRVAYSRIRALPTKLRYPGEGPIPRR